MTNKIKSVNHPSLSSPDDSKPIALPGLNTQILVATDLQNLSPDEMRTMLHDLRVHQIELEMQNDELRRTQHELEISRSRYFNLYDLAPIGYLTLNEQGLIKEANLAAAALLGEERGKLLNHPLSRFIHRDDQDRYYLHRHHLMNTQEVQDWQMRLLRNDNSPLWVRLLAAPSQNGGCWLTLIDMTERNKMEEELLKSQQSLKRQNDLFSSLLANLPMGVFMVDVPSGKPLVANDSALKLLGRGILPDVSSHNLSEVYKAYKMGSHEPYPQEKMPIVRGMKGEVSHIDDMVVERPDGTETLLEIFGSPVTDENGQTWASLVSFSDITERKQAERVLQARLRISEYALEHSLNELLTKVLDEAEALTTSQIGFFHFVAADQVNLSLQTWSTQTLSTICKAEGVGHHYPLERAGVWADCIREKRPLIHNDYASLPHRKGLPPGHAPVYREMVVPIFRNKKIVGVLGVGNKLTDYTHQEIKIIQHLANLAWDIVTRKRAEDELRSSELKYSRLFESMTDAYVCVDMDGQILETNTAYQQLTGYSQEELTTLTYKQLTPDKWSGLEREIEQQILTRGYSDIYEKEYRRKDGTIITVELKTFLLRGTDQKPTGMWAIIRDITDRKRAEEELRQAQIAAEAANTAKSQFLANMSHEIRTPMNGVIGLIELLLSTELTNEQREYAKMVKASGKNLVELISNILDLSKIEAHKIELEEINFNLREEMNDTIDFFLLSAQEKGLELKAQIDPDVPLLLKGDPRRLRQILSNLIGNSIKFTQNGSISLHVRTESGDKEHTTLRFLVRDTGIGIVAEKLGKIFEPFTQADSSTTRKYGGTGLGLSIARQLATLMGGTIGVESREAEGATFWFTAEFGKPPERRNLPRSLTVANEQGESTSKKTEIVPNVRILLAEDDITSQIMTKAILTKFGYEVDVAKNGYEALKLLAEIDYTVVLMDCMMPELNGYEATAIIRNPSSAVRNHAIPVIALTANAMQEDRDSCLAAGMDDYLSKPIVVTNVLAMLKKWISLDNSEETEI